MPGYIAKPPFCILQRDHPLAQGLVGAWPFDIGGGGKHVRDLSGRGNHGTAQAFNKWVGGAFGWCMNFNGADDYVLLDDTDTLRSITTNLTVTAWFMPNVTIDSGITGDIGLIDYGDVVTTGNWLIFWYGTNGGDGGRMRLPGTYGGNVQTTTDTWNAGQWYFVAFSFVDSSSVCAYVNSICENSGGTDTIEGNAYPLNIGRRTQGIGYFNGRIADVRIYNRALSAEEIAAIYHDPWEIYRPHEMTLRAQYIVAALYRMLRRRAR